MVDLPSRRQFGDYQAWTGRAVLDADGRRLGEVREIYLDLDTDAPEWVLVRLDGGDSRFIPLASATVLDDELRVAHREERVRSAPGVDPAKRIGEEEERVLYDHYGVRYSESESTSGLPADATSEDAAAGAPAPDAEAAAATPEAAAPALDTDAPEAAAEAPDADAQAATPEAPAPTTDSPDAPQAPALADGASPEPATTDATPSEPELDRRDAQEDLAAVAHTPPAPVPAPEGGEDRTQLRPWTPDQATPDPAPTWTAPPPGGPGGPGGPLGVLRTDRRAQVGVAAAAALLLLIVRRLRS